MSCMHTHILSADMVYQCLMLLHFILQTIPLSTSENSHYDSTSTYKERVYHNIHGHFECFPFYNLLEHKLSEGKP